MKKTTKKRRLMPDMALDAFQIWPVLAWAANNQQTMTYKDLSKLTGIPWNTRTSGGRMSKCLEIIYRYCETKMGCYLTVLVVTQENGKPGGEYFVTKGDYDKARQQIFDLAKKNKLTNPGREKFDQFIEEWNDKYFS